MKKMKILRSFFGFLAMAQCPVQTVKETNLDCPWAGVTRSLEGVTQAPTIKQTIEQSIPGFLATLESDAKSRQLLGLWGISRNMDESNLNVKTVPPNLLAYFNSILKVDYDDSYSVGHAGLNHTYGYLFSNLRTPYGYKRARYVQGEIESGFGLPAQTFSGVPKKGSLLGNMTYFIGSLAFRDSKSRLSRISLQEILDQKQIALSDELLSFDFKKLKIKRLLETIDSDKFFLEMRTDIVEFNHTNTLGSNVALLIYSLDFHAPGQESRPLLITAFPVLKEFGDALFAQDAIGSDKSVTLKLKYNAMLPISIPPEQMLGKRSLFHEQNGN